MEPVDKLRFSVSDRVNGAEISPNRVPLSLLDSFPKEVNDFLKGTTKDVDPSELLVSVAEGSFALGIPGLLVASSLWVDLQRLQSQESLNLIDPKRAEIVERWQASTKQNPQRKYMVVDEENGVNWLQVDSSSGFRKVEDFWAPTEKYVHGKITDIGGKTKPNIHLQTSDGLIMTISATESQLAREERNLLYREILLHINVEENLRTGEVRNQSLLAFVTRKPAYDEGVFQKMVEKGTAAWSDVASATEWLEDLRGGKA